MGLGQLADQIRSRNYSLSLPRSRRADEEDVEVGVENTWAGNPNLLL